VRELLLGARLTLAGGRTGLLRTLIAAFGIGLGVAALLLAAALPTIHGERQQRQMARDYVTADADRPGTLLLGNVQTEFRAERVSGRLLQAESPGAPVPPGLERLPAPGELFVSPALRALLETPEGRRGLAPRLPGKVAGEIAPAGLLGPGELGFYAGARGLAVGGPVMRIESFGYRGPGQSLDPVLALLVVIALVALLIPVGVVVGAAVRTGGEDRDRRLAALRLIGADERMAHRIAAGEALVAAALGLVLGLGFFLVARGLIERVSFQGLSVYAGDVRPTAALGALVVVGVPAAAVIVSLIALRQVVTEPLGVVRRAGPGRPRKLVWRLVLPLAGLALLLPTLGQDEDDVSAMALALGIIALLVGVAALLPWVVERTVARLGSGAVAWQLAVRRLQLDPGGASRAVSGIAVAVAGAIALQMVFTGAQAKYEQQTGADPNRARLYVTLEGSGVGAPQLARRLSAVPGVRSVSAATEYAGNTALYVAPCPALRELAAIRSCTDGDVFATRKTLDAPAGATFVDSRKDPAGLRRQGVFATPGAPRDDRAPIAVHAYVRANRDVEDAVRAAAAALDPLIAVDPIERIATDAQFDILRRAMFAGAAIVIGLIGLSLLLTALEQLRERRRALAVLVAFGTRRSTLSWSLLWQSAVPVGLGLAVAVLAGLGLGALLLRIVGAGFHVAWLDVLGIVAVGAAVVVLVTATSLPVLFRTMRPEGLRTE
jgi:hypothetical protein